MGEKNYEFDCFISYCAREHRAAAEALYLILRLAGLRVWFDGVDFYQGDIRDTTCANAERCRQFVVIYSAGWDDSPPCNDELDRFTAANSGNAPLVVQFGPQVPSTRFRSRLNYDLSKPDEWGKLLRALGVDDSAAKELLGLRWPSTANPLVEFRRQLADKEELLRQEQLKNERLQKHIVSSDEVKRASAEKLADIRIELKAAAKGTVIRKRDLTPQRVADLEKAAPAYAAESARNNGGHLEDLITACLMDDYDGAVRTAQKLEGTFQSSAEFLFYWGNALSGLGRHEEACEKFEKSCNLAPDNHVPYNNWGAALEKLGKYHEAIAKYETALRIQPNAAEVNHNLGVVYVSLGRLDLALEAFNRAFQQRQDVGTLIAWAGALEMNGDDEEARRKYELAIERQPEFAPAHAHLGAVLSRLGLFEDACAAFRRANELEPNVTETYNEWGNALYSLGKYEEAREKYDRSIELDPNRAATHFNSGNALFKLKLFELASKEYQRAAELGPGMPEAYNNWGTCLAELGHLGEAFRKYSWALALDTGNAEARANIGSYLFRIGEFEKARESYSRSLELSPDLTDALAGMGATLMHLGEDKEALKMLDKALASDPLHTAALVNKGELLFYAGEDVASMELLRKAIAAGDERAIPGARIILAACLARQGDSVGAKRELEMQNEMELRGFTVVRQNKLFDAFKPYADDARFLELVNNVRKRLELEEKNVGD